MAARLSQHFLALHVSVRIFIVPGQDFIAILCNSDRTKELITNVLAFNKCCHFLLRYKWFRIYCKVLRTGFFTNEFGNVWQLIGHLLRQGCFPVALWIRRLLPFEMSFFVEAGFIRRCKPGLELCSSIIS